MLIICSDGLALSGEHSKSVFKYLQLLKHAGVLVYLVSVGNINAKIDRGLIAADGAFYVNAIKDVVNLKFQDNMGKVVLSGICTCFFLLCFVYRRRSHPSNGKADLGRNHLLSAVLQSFL